MGQEELLVGIQNGVLLNTTKLIRELGNEYSECKSNKDVGVNVSQKHLFDIFLGMNLLIF